MKNENTLLQILMFSLCLMLMNFTCKDCEDSFSDFSYYSIYVSPENSVYEINDTIKIGATLKSLFELEYSETTYENANENIQFEFQIFSVEPNGENITDANESFEIIGSEGIISQLDPRGKLSIFQVANTCSQSICSFKTSIIPGESGYFGICLLGGMIGEYNPCQVLSLWPDRIICNNNNFSICEEIGTTSLRHNSSFYTSPETEGRFYFFKVNG